MHERFVVVKNSHKQTKKIKACFYKSIKELGNMDFYIEEGNEPGTRKKADIVCINKNDEIIVIEQKRNIADCDSGNGLNFFGDFNFLLIPSEALFDVLLWMKRHKEKLSDVGLLVYKNDAIYCFKESKNYDLDFCNI